MIYYNIFRYKNGDQFLKERLVGKLILVNGGSVYVNF